MLSTKGHYGSLSRQLTQSRLLEWESSANWGLGRKGWPRDGRWGSHQAGAFWALGQISLKIWRMHRFLWQTWPPAGGELCSEGQLRILARP